MFFIGLTMSLLLIGTGIILMIQSSTILGGFLTLLGVVSFILLIQHYRSRNKRKRKEEGDEPFWADCSCSSSSIPNPLDCDGDKGLDCDCSPDCSP